MIIKAGFLIVALVSAVKVCQITNRHSRKPSDSDQGKASFDEEQSDKENGKSEESHLDPKEEKKMQDKTSKSRLVVEVLEERKDVSEIDVLKNVVKEKEKKSESQEIRLLEFYCLKEQKSRTALLQKQLNDRTVEINMLRVMIDMMKNETEKLREQAKLNRLTEEQLQSAQHTILQLQRQMELDPVQLKGQLAMLKEQISRFRVEEEFKVAHQIDQKLKAHKPVELKAWELKRRNIQLQLEKRELVFRLNAAKSKIAELSAMTEHKVVAKYKEEITKLRRTNKNLTEQVDKLHQNRFSILEELVYQRWLNFCLKFELADHRSPSPKKIMPNVSRRLDFQSDSFSSGISSTESDEISNTTSSSTSENTKNKKKGLLENIKRWGRIKSSSFTNALESRFSPSKDCKIRRFSTSSVPSSILDLRRNIEQTKKDSVVDSDSPDTPAIQRLRRVSFNDSITSVRYIYNDSPESDQGVLDICQKNAEEVNDSCSDMKTSSAKDEISDENDADIPMPSSNGIDSEIHEVSTAPFNQEIIQRQEDSKKETVEEEFLSSEMHYEASGASNFGEVLNLIAAMIIVFFLIMFYFNHFFP